MKKQRSGKLAVLLLALLIVLLGGCSETQPEQSAQKVYWNVDKFTYSTGPMGRVPSGQTYLVRMAVDGAQVNVQVADEKTVKYMDTMEVMGLVFDENGIVVDVIPVEQMGYSIVAEDDYITSVSADTLCCNSTPDHKGLEKRFAITDNTQVYMIDEAGGVLCGLQGTLKVQQRILALADEAGALTHVYTVDPFAIGDVYWNHARQFDSVTKLSTRPLDDLGRFVYNFSLNGEEITLYTRNQEVANAIDGVAARCMGLEFDENGYISGVLATKKVTGGGSWGSWYYIMDIDGNIISGEKFTGSNVGSTTRGTMAEDCKVYDVSGKGAYMGEPTQLRQYDQVHGLKNEYGEICVLFVVGRTYQADIYYNVNRQYNSVTKTTRRTPATDGYYYIKLAHNGQQMTLKTKDKEIANAIDATSVRCFGLKVEGDEILEVYVTSTVWGGRQFCSYDIVTAIDPDGTITAREVDVEKKGAQTYIGRMAKDCGIYNVSSTATVVGEKTALQVGDKIHALKDWKNNITHIFVVGRSYNVPIYWNVDRQYDSTNKTTKRIANEEGYYEILLAINGEQKTYKTKSLALITGIDAVATKCFGLITNGDIITKMYKTAYVNGGTQFCSWDYVTSINGATVVATEAGDDSGKTYTDYMTQYTKIYNVSGTGEFIGEETTLEVGDKIHALKYATGGLNIIYVLERTEKVVEETAYCQLCDQDVTWYSWDGTAAMEDGKHYFLRRNIQISATAYIGNGENSEAHVTLDLRGFDITASVRAFRIYGIFDLLGEGNIYCNASGQAAGFYVYDAGVFNMYGGRFVGGSIANTQCGIGALGLKEGSNATFNMYGGSLEKGNTQKDGGNLTLYHSSVFNMYGGVITEGQTMEDGGNISANAKAKINLYGGSIVGETANVCGGQICVYADRTVVVSHAVLSAPMHIPNALPEGSSILVTLTGHSGAVTGQTPESNLDYIRVSEGELVWQNGVLLVKAPADRTAYCDHCQMQASWYVWDGAYTLEDKGHYYLSDEVTVSSTAYIGQSDNKDVSVCLDLNGNNIQASVRVFRIYGNLNLMDMAGGGVITGNTAGQASVFYVYENAVFNFYGGTMTAKKTVTSNSGAGIGGVDKGTMNMYGGMITGGTATKSGGNLNLYNTGELNLYGGVIEKGTSLEASGGNIHMSANSRLHIYGGSILGGSAGNLGDCINANGAVTLHGQTPITVTEIYLPGTKTLSIDGILPAESSIGILLAAETGAFTGNTEEANGGCFHHDTYDVVFAGGKLALQVKEVPPEEPDAHWHCICGGLGARGDHTSCNKVVWTPWPGVDSLVLDGSVYYYLTEDVTVDAAIKLAEGQTLNLCLNGCTISTDKKIYIFDISGTLNICDHSENKGAVTNLYSGTSHSMAFYLRGSASGSQFNLYGGTYSAPNGKSTGTGGCVARVGTTAGTATFKMYGGTIVGGTAAGSAVAGNLVLEQGSSTYLYGGSITGGSNTKGAGNLILKNGASVIMDGGSITNGSGTDGGNVYVKSGCSLTVLCGSITGGSVYAEGTVTVSDGAIVESIEYPQ